MRDVVDVTMNYCIYLSLIIRDRMNIVDYLYFARYIMLVVIFVVVALCLLDE